MCSSDLPDIPATAVSPPADFRRRRPAPHLVDHPSGLRVRPATPLPSPASHPPRLLSPSIGAGGHRRARVLRTGQETGLNRPAGRLLLLGARPSPRPGPATRPACSVGASAWHPDWAGSEAGGLCHWPGLPSGLGRFTGRPAQYFLKNWKMI